jgi:predicted S18 family serine protease
MGCGGSKPGAESATLAADAPWHQKALAATKDAMSAAKEKMDAAYDATRPHVVNAAEKTWAATKAAAAASKEFCIDVADSSKATTQMALLEASYRGAKKRLAYDKETFGEKIFAELEKSLGDGSQDAKDGKLVGCLEEGCEALRIYREAVTKFKEHMQDMEDAKKEIAELKKRVKEAWKTNSAEQKKIEQEFEKIEKAEDKVLPGADDGNPVEQKL